MAIEDENKGSTATGSWVGKGTGAGSTDADQKRQTLGTQGTSDHIDETHAGSGAEGSLGSGLGGAGSPMGGTGASAMRTPASHEQGHEGAFQDWDTSTNPLIASNRVEGTAVYSQSRERLGTIQHIMIDKLSGQSEFAVMSFGGFLGSAAITTPSHGTS